MTSKTNNSKNFFEAVMDTQNQTLDAMVDNAKKLTNGNSLMNEGIEKGAEFFKKGLNSTKETMDTFTAQTQKMQEESTKANDKMADYFQNWKDQQTTAANQMKEWNSQFMNHWMNPSNSQQYFQQMQNNWMNSFQQPTMEGMMNPTQWQENMTKAGEQMNSFWSQLQQAITTNYNEVAKNMQNGTTQDAFKGMVNMTEGFSKFYEMWMPMLKSMNDKSFNMDTFKNMLNMDQYKTFMDKYFSFVPQTNTDYMNNMKNMFTNGFRQNQQAMNEMMGNAKSSWSNMFPMMNNNNPFMNMMNGYNQFQQQMSSSVSPFMKLMTPNNDMKTMQEWNDIINQLNVYNIKSSELQYMVYETGMKVMEGIAENVMHKVENGEEVNSMMKLYQEWLNLSDAQYVKLFETDAYSQLMAEVSSLQLGIKKEVELQMEKSFVNIPVVTRSEMNEVYQTLYDLKKELRSTAKAKTTTAATATATTTTETPAETPAAKAPVKKVEKTVSKKATTKRK